MPVEIEFKVSRSGIKSCHAQDIRMAFEQSSISAQSVVKLASCRRREALGRLHVQFVAIQSGSVAPADPCSPTKTSAPFLKLPQRKAGRVSQERPEDRIPAEGVVREQAPGPATSEVYRTAVSRLEKTNSTGKPSPVSLLPCDPLTRCCQRSRIIPKKRRHAVRPRDKPIERLQRCGEFRWG